MSQTSDSRRFITECNHRALRHQAKSSPVMPIQWALFEAWKPKDGSVDIHCFLMVPEVAENPQTAGQP
ncbi:uncharacterized protein TrAtP1_002161 [Trichoderma atroviride]|uniref:uncharacterized protein n=1 Tax=Hypocrea atroviridis TaxID=63577 RepID=UPI0033260317|nr:hypothetical protein TrAtP1_002161 [Trichoderma atroviride]